ncbi:methyltransferase family protein [Nonomuraea sp. NPDC050394]|uniref:methyltransferase family protein n=1 Tax=Nonomuraea sp. NPDC050394 TaxID=3364363 RepID=UPI0037ACCCE8
MPARGIVPWALTRWEAADLGGFALPAAVVGGLLVVAGIGTVVHAFVQVVVRGSGAPAPVAPPERLVVGGIYRHVRNPIYVAILAVILGQAIMLGRPVLLLYAAVLGSGFALFARLYEEPHLRRVFGEEYTRYRAAVRGWWPRVRPYRPLR